MGYKCNVSNLHRSNAFIFLLYLVPVHTGTFLEVLFRRCTGVYPTQPPEVYLHYGQESTDKALRVVSGTDQDEVAGLSRGGL